MQLLPSGYIVLVLCWRLVTWQAGVKRYGGDLCLITRVALLMPETCPVGSLGSPFLLGVVPSGTGWVC